ncbi:tyrosine recombinase XerC [Alkalibacillus haloalkaliphilus]|uniref:tyrosine recombinase XerC n=1 Tax=Alkalibacillus haloalkaliphilus TaxID=94136 RepID=UPI002936CD38|nr:tyrosine recombinase XerC [Alkalibacillus haloalkaliphilus]MDV2580590.1 tyrosine recombinase XerC [Alkalibacillus haloalkaliphilus]
MNTDNLINQFRQFLIVERNASPHTVNQYVADLQQFNLFLSKEVISHFNAVTHSDIRLYLTELYNAGLSRVSASRKLSSLRTFYYYLEKECIVDHNPIEYVSMPKRDKKIPQFFYAEELERLFNVEDCSQPLGQRNQALIEILYATGIRVSELVQIKLTDIDYTLSTILVHGKGNKERYVPFGAYAQTAVKEYIADGRKELISKSKEEVDQLFINFRGTPLTDEGVRYILNDMMKRAALTSSIHPHKLRHTFATHLLNEGADMRSVQEMLGHESLSSTQIYTHVTKDYLQNIYKNAHPRA